jgi:hypothetical protein
MKSEQGFNGIWQFDKEEDTDFNSERDISDVYTFISENNTLIINLPSESSAKGLPDDHIYRIKTRWKGNDLFVFAPLGNKWELFATWDNNRFVMYGDRKVKIFKRISPEEIAEWQKNLLKSGRGIWSYPYINPDEVEI